MDYPGDAFHTFLEKKSFTKERGHTPYFQSSLFLFICSHRIHHISNHFYIFFIKNTIQVEEGAPKQKPLGYYIFYDMRR